MKECRDDSNDNRKGSNKDSSNTEPEIHPAKETLTKIELPKRDILTNDPNLKECRDNSNDKRKGSDNDKTTTIRANNNSDNTEDASAPKGIKKTADNSSLDAEHNDNTNNREIKAHKQLLVSPAPKC